MHAFWIFCCGALHSYQLPHFTYFLALFESIVSLRFQVVVARRRCYPLMLNAATTAAAQVNALFFVVVCFELYSYMHKISFEMSVRCTCTCIGDISEI